MVQTLTVLSHDCIAKGVYLLTVDAPEMAKASLPGQFVMVKGWEGNDPFLMRPFCIDAADREKGTLSVLYKVKGKGTELLSKAAIGSKVQMIGPLGHGWPVPEGAKRIAIVGRGIGIAAIRLLAEDCRRNGIEVAAYLSAKCEEEVFHRADMERAGVLVRATTDPSVKITDAFARDCETMHFDAAYSCGSKRLAGEMKKLHKQYGFPGYISLEEHMACGIGACKGCVCEIQDTQTGEKHYERVCKDGPVFPIDSVVL